MPYPDTAWCRSRSRTFEQLDTLPSSTRTTKEDLTSPHSDRTASPPFTAARTAARRMRSALRGPFGGNSRRIDLACRCAASFAASLVVATVIAAPAFADSTASSLTSLISNLTGWLVGLLAGVATLFLTLGGLRYLTAGGDPGQVEKAKIALKSAAVGYALAALAPLLVSILASLVS